MTGKMSPIVYFLAKLAWFESADAGLRWLAGVRSHKFEIADCGWSGQQMQDLLKRYGVKIWGRGFTKNSLTFRVNRKQARWAEYLLHQNGLAVISKPVDARNVDYPRREGFQDAARGATTTGKSGTLDDLAGLLADIFG